MWRPHGQHHDGRARASLVPPAGVKPRDFMEDILVVYLHLFKLIRPLRHFTIVPEIPAQSLALPATIMPAGEGRESQTKFVEARDARLLADMRSQAGQRQARTTTAPGAAAAAGPRPRRRHATITDWGCC